MKTNVKNGLFVYGTIPVDTASILLADANTGEGIDFFTGADGLYYVLAETDAEGYVTNLIVDVSISLKDGGMIEVEEGSIIMKDGEEYATLEEHAQAEAILSEVPDEYKETPKKKLQ